MQILITIFLGLIIGLVARLFTPGKNPSGIILTTLLGIAGAIVAKYIGEAFGWYHPGEPAGFMGSVLGAMLILFLNRMLRGFDR